ncbi:hypothetical protein OH76DRAFT_1484385 [Lentinus brumalis]|uniref:Uncharacterized protein n=1 Tax=Lentinus brumalis TaxID=2498619 RepID=A0A371D603_9APHY|nr:hypothetical protein OH76DRAFT_1484385 [Polyporus brumalis]
MASPVYLVRGVLIHNNYHPSLRDAVEEAQSKGIVVALFPALERVEHIPDEMERYGYGSKPWCYDYRVARELKLTPVPKEFRWADKRKQSKTLLHDVLRSAQDGEDAEGQNDGTDTPAIAHIEAGSESEYENEEDQLVSDDEPAPAKAKGKASPVRRSQGSQVGKADGGLSKKAASRKRKAGQTGQTGDVKPEPKKTKKNGKDSTEDMLLRLLANSEEALEIARELLEIQRSKSGTIATSEAVAGPSRISGSD